MTSPAANRRDFLALGAAAMAAAAIPATTTAATTTAFDGSDLKQSICQWCYSKAFTLEQMCEVAKKLGCGSIELVKVEDWPILKKHGLICALTGSHWFDKGMNNPKYQDECIAKMKKAIDDCAAAKFPTVITFTGFREDISDEDGIKNCVKGYKQVVGYAEKHGINLSLEMLNSRVKEDMKGHPGYQGDHVDYCMEIIKQVGSPRLGLLFDFYHVQIMDGDILTRFLQNAEVINHVHTAGNPGRKELDADQEINYSAVFATLAKAKYKGYIGHEFIPTRDAMSGLKEATDMVRGSKS